jgi:phage terminase large subunit-like protein
MGPACDSNLLGGHRMNIIGPTLGDISSACFEGPSGLEKLDPGCRMMSQRGSTFVVFPNGTKAKCVGGDIKSAPNRLRAHGNTCFTWIEEAAAVRWLPQIMDQIELSMRMGPKPQWIASTTPLPRLVLKRMRDDPRVKTTTATLFDNAYLSDSFKQRVLERYEGTRLYRQEVEGILLEDTPGALWNQNEVDAKRINLTELKGRIPIGDETHEEYLTRALGLTTTLVCIDPATSGRGDRTGLSVIGGDARGVHPDKRRHAYILEDMTARMVPSVVDLGDALGDEDLDDNIRGWTEVAAEAAYRWSAHAIVVERNRLGRTAFAAIRAAGFTGRIIELDAKESKFMRAVPVRAAWPRRVWIVGSMPILEEEMTSWIPSDGDKPDSTLEMDADPNSYTGSPDALDAAVHGVRQILQIGSAPSANKVGATLGSALESGWTS